MTNAAFWLYYESFTVNTMAGQFYVPVLMKMRRFSFEKRSSLI